MFIKVKNRVLRFLIFVQDVISSEKVMSVKRSKKILVIKFTGKNSRIRKNAHSKVNVSSESNHFLLKRIIKKSMRGRKTEEDFLKGSN